MYDDTPRSQGQLTGAGLLLFFLGLVWGSNPATADELAGVNYIGDLPTLVADKQGFFAEQGLAVQVSYGLSGKDNLVRLRDGDVEFALMALTPLVLDYLDDPRHQEAHDPVIVANLVHAVNLNQVVSLDPEARPTAQWFRNKRVGLMKGTNAAFFWSQFAYFYGISPDSIRLTHYPTSQLPDRLLSQEIDAAVMWEPWVSYTVQQSDKRLRVLNHSNVYIAKWVLVTRRETLENRPDRVGALLKAYQNAVDFIERQPSRAAELYSEMSRLDTQTILSEIDIQDYSVSLDWSLVVALQQQFEWARRAGHGLAYETGEPLSLIAADPLRKLFPLAVSIPDSPVKTAPGAAP